MTVGGFCCDGVLSPRSPLAYAGGRRAAGRRSLDVVVFDGELERRPSEAGRLGLTRLLAALVAPLVQQVHERLIVACERGSYTTRAL